MIIKPCIQGNKSAANVGEITAPSYQSVHTTQPLKDEILYTTQETCSIIQLTHPAGKKKQTLSIKRIYRTTKQTKHPFFQPTQPPTKPAPNKETSRPSKIKLQNLAFTISNFGRDLGGHQILCRFYIVCQQRQMQQS